MAHVRKMSTQRRLLLLFQGLAAAGLGVVLLIDPVRPLRFMLMLAGAYFVLYGVATLLYMGVRKHHKGWKIFVGSLAILGGVSAIVAMEMTGGGYYVLYSFFVSQALFGGVTEFVTGSRRGDPGLAGLGALAFVLGALFGLAPFIGLVWLGLGIGFSAAVGASIVIPFAVRGERELAKERPLVSW